MSGPKVVRIVTREEILAICEGHLRRLEQMFERWQAQATRLGEASAAEIAAIRARHDRLRQLLQDDQLLALQKEVPEEITFLARDLAEREERAVDTAARVRQSQRNLRDNAATLLRSLEAATPPADSSLVDALRAIAAGRAHADADAVVARGFAQLGPANPANELSEQQRALAEAMQVDLERPRRWIAEDRAFREPRLAHIDQHIARLQTLHGDASAAPFLRRLDAIERAPGPADPHRNMLLDSLVVDLAAAAADWQARRERIATLRTLADEVETLLGNSGTALSARVAVCLAAPCPDMAQVDVLAQQCTDVIAQELHRRAAVARRRAVLEGLASLGYEVREGMETAWADAGSVVLRKAATPGYGVEVGGRAETGRLQVRPVSLTDTRDRSRDRDIETIWCGEFTRLRSLLAKRGSELTIEKALAIGEVPLKVIEIENYDGTEATSTNARHSS
ncbi:hypothetical protein VDR81_20980 [Xanthomonas campestris pv. campestris]|uniref:hypothetical protein n=1 Tax=uncultured Xanthomonas sp. TaxID=152831 RepID=UPI0025FB4F9C|nr:hypothetical protein [uncultured Xanthomonas sp.]MEB1894700.1 hypothetical protein [Xanthomonas campestris pv. campestris]MEB2015129.1 hypothetical protein [Xanthomonas campestris pv. campestris]MEB2039535.1 hypothetical protein [Xanthomonas campestris pv. campestris]